jgi:hypothetical protein
MIVITAVRLEGGHGHEHITDVLWCGATAVGQTTRQAIVEWLSECSDNEARVFDTGSWVHVQVARRPCQTPYLRTRSRGAWTDHLLSLPRFSPA